MSSEVARLRSPDGLTGGLVVGADLKRLVGRATAAIGLLAEARRPCKIICFYWAASVGCFRDWRLLRMIPGVVPSNSAA